MKRVLLIVPLLLLAALSFSPQFGPGVRAIAADASGLSRAAVGVPLPRAPARELGRAGGAARASTAKLDVVTLKRLLATNTSKPPSTRTPPPTATCTPTAAAPTSTAPAQSRRLLYWGAMLPNAAVPSADNLQPGGIYDAFEQRANKKMSIYHWGAPWKMRGSFLAFQTSYFDNTRNRGAIPLLDWGSWELGRGPVQSEMQLQDIYDGTYDGFIEKWASDAKGWGHPFFMRFDWEMNGWWQFPWVEQINGNRPGDYVRAWRHVHDIFRDKGVTNVSWVWCPNIASDKSTPLASLYPGDAYVDWTCLDGYNKDNSWLWFDQVFSGRGISWLQNSYQQVLTIAPRKPMMIGETGSLEAGDGGAKKARWLADGLAQLIYGFPGIQAVVYFSWNDGAGLAVDSSEASQNAFRQAIAPPNYVTNQFSRLDTSPIPPPK